ncbi:BTAD domain-containing putative transcriptional regulator [Nocardioides humi]|uniref:BTAD domain-containing putative transcriptional regulator n=1 Tax=Nocardioides humi TaxID=449461 RepID=UPI0031D84FE6
MVDSRDETRPAGAPPPDRAHRFIIRRKLQRPEPAHDVVVRDRLTVRLRDLLGDHRVVEVLGTAGAGKTTAVVLALRGLDRPVAWLTLDGTEQAAGRLLVYLEAAVGAHVPGAADVASDALSSNLQIGEAAGLLAESLQGSGMVVVCDNVERVAADEGCLAVLSSFAKYLPPEVNLVLVSREDLHLDLGSSGEHRLVGRLTEEDLAFDREEARSALVSVGREDADPDRVLAATGGWVTGVLFEGWARPEAGPTDPDSVRAYVSANIFGSLTPAEQTFLVHTSLLGEVTIDGARSLGQANAAQLVARLRQRHLPVTWSADRQRLTPHPVFRDFLRATLDSEDATTRDQVRRRYAEVLIARGEREEAVDELLRLGDLDAAGRLAADALPHLVARMDFSLAARWLDTLGATSQPPNPVIGSVVLRVAFALEQCGRGVDLIDRYGDAWLPAPGEPGFEEAHVLAAWCLWHSGRLSEARVIAGRVPEGRNREIVQTLIGLAADERPPELPQLSTMPSGPLDGLLMRLAYMRGRFDGLDEPGSFDPWRTILGGPWVVAALRATGRLDEAMTKYAERSGADQPVWLHAIDAVDLMLDVGRADEAWALLRHGRELIATTGSVVFHNMSLLAEAKLLLRLERNAPAADRVLADAASGGALDYAFTRDAWRLWSGLSLLHQDRDTEAHDLLAACLGSMRRGDRQLDLPAAAVYLAEAQWRLGLEDESDETAEFAMECATQLGSQHLLLTALADMPAVATRSADNVATRTSPWHRALAVLSGQSHVSVHVEAPRLVLEEFGDPVLTVDGAVVQPRLTKSVELLSYLLGAPARRASRVELLGALFGGRNDGAGRSYLRQALYRLREVLPEELSPAQDGDVFSLAGPDLALGTAQLTVDLIAQAGRQDGTTRLATLERAIAATRSGPFLKSMSGEWLNQRREDLREALLAARVDAATIAYQLSRYREAKGWIDEVLQEDPYREQAWQLAIRLAQGTGSDDAVLALYQRYAARMRELGVPPSDDVRRLVTQFRR